MSRLRYKSLLTLCRSAQMTASPSIQCIGALPCKDNTNEADHEYHPDPQARRHPPLRRHPFGFRAGRTG
ncbi:protein of unknown function [Thauera humireducens]|nr:protein of unknown function [Thauera humireducens]